MVSWGGLLGEGGGLWVPGGGGCLGKSVLGRRLVTCSNRGRGRGKTKLNQKLNQLWDQQQTATNGSKEPPARHLLTFFSWRGSVGGGTLQGYHQYEQDGSKSCFGRHHCASRAVTRG